MEDVLRSVLRIEEEARTIVAEAEHKSKEMIAKAEAEASELQSQAEKEAAQEAAQIALAARNEADAMSEGILAEAKEKAATLEKQVAARFEDAIILVVRRILDV